MQQQKNHSINGDIARKMMNETLLSLTSDYVFTVGNKPVKTSELHSPYFLAICPSGSKPETVRNRLIKRLKKSNTDDTPLGKISHVGDIEEYQSFWDFNETRNVFKVYTKRSYFVPEVSDYLFFELGIYTGEHDIPYAQRALVDIAAEGKAWPFDTNGQKKKLNVLVYDIETTEYKEGKTNVPIDVIGYSDFNITFESKKNLQNEEFDFEVTDCSADWKDADVQQLVSHNLDEEIESLTQFCKLAPEYDVISGHNLVGFDNMQIEQRLQWLLKEKRENLSKKQVNRFQGFLDQYTRTDRSFHFGVGSEVVYMYPCTFDTFLGARKFYSFLNEFSLKALAPFLGIDIEGRLYLLPSQMKLDEKTLKYNRQDVREQIGVTTTLLQQALPLSFTTCMTFDELLSSGAVNMWDHMGLLRAKKQKKIMPATARALSIAQSIRHDFADNMERKEIAAAARKRKEQLSKQLTRVVKYGEEMPDWVEYPYVVYNKTSSDDDDVLGYHIPGGMTIKPDIDAKSHFVPWYHVVVADVGAMYPTILKALNIGADTVRPARKDETPDTWVWLRRIPEKFMNTREVQWREISEKDAFADEGFLIGVKIDDKPGVVNQAMSGIMNHISKVKKELKTAQSSTDEEEKKRLKMSYQSLKGARNAGTHGILSAPKVSGRQFNAWGAAAITTRGQTILSDTLQYLEGKDIRVVYGDTDGIYLGCSRSISDVPQLQKALNIPADKTSEQETWLTKPEEAYTAVEECNERWRKNLDYPEFELEAENHDAMLFVKHKNYLIFDTTDGHLQMKTKGNNFKGSDKANIARIALDRIMREVLRENPHWKNEKEARSNVRNSIKKKTREILKTLDLSKVDLEELTLVQSVQPSKRYKPNQDGSISTYGRRAQALEDLIGEPIKSRTKFKFVVTRRALPGIPNPSKSGVKPIDYMFPLDLLEDKSQIDLEWYKQMIENFIKGAFGLSEIEPTEQKDLDAWM